MEPLLSIITLTGNRRTLLMQCIERVKAQSLGGIEHIVVAVCPTPSAEVLCRRAGVKSLSLPRPAGDFGKTAMDVGLRAATGNYVAFWRTSNLYEQDAAETLVAAAAGHDIGVASVNYWLPIRCEMITVPRRWKGSIDANDIDTVNCCARRQFVLDTGVTFARSNPSGRPQTEAFWLELQNRGARINYSSGIVGTRM